MIEEWNLFVSCEAGLCNRLRVLFSSIILAKASSRKLTFIWPINNACGARFSDLFENDYNVINAAPMLLPQNIKIFDFRTEWQEFIPDLTKQNENNLFIHSYSWLFSPKHYSEHSKLKLDSEELITSLKVKGDILTKINKFREDNFNSKMIGVHLRRADFEKYRPDVTGNTKNAIEKVLEYMKEAPDSRIFLATDENPEGDSQLEFVRTFGNKLCMYNKESLNRHNISVIKDALIELLLLRKTDYFVGTLGSSFSEFCYMGLTRPYVLVYGNSEKISIIFSIAEKLGAFKLLKLFFNNKFAASNKANYIIYRQLIDNTRINIKSLLSKIKHWKFL